MAILLSKSVVIVNTIKENPITKIDIGKPSLYITKKKEKYTNAKPVSFWRIISIAGNKAKPIPMIRCFHVLKLVSGEDKNLAIAKAVNILHTSPG